MVDSLMSPRYHSETSITKFRVDSKSCLLVQKGKGILKGSSVNISNFVEISQYSGFSTSFQMHHKAI